MPGIPAIRLAAPVITLFTLYGIGILGETGWLWLEEKRKKLNFAC